MAEEGRREVKPRVDSTNATHHLRALQWSEPDDGSSWWRTYGITEATRAKMIEAQGRKCAICRLEKDLYVDHCHTTGKVRGLLCCSCNTGLGQLGDNASQLELAVAYLSHAATTGADAALRRAWSLNTEKAKQAREAKRAAALLARKADTKLTAERRKERIQSIASEWPNELLVTFPKVMIDRTEGADTRWTNTWTMWCPRQKVDSGSLNTTAITRVWQHAYVDGRKGIGHTADILGMEDFTPAQTVGFFTCGILHMVDHQLRTALGIDANGIIDSVWGLLSETVPRDFLNPWHHKARDVLPVCPSWDEIRAIRVAQDLIAISAAYFRRIIDSWSILVVRDSCRTVST